MKNNHKIDFEIDVTPHHITLAGRSHGRWTPVDVAILQQTAYLPVGMLDENLQLMDERGIEYSCPVPEAMLSFLRRFSQGLSVGPARFALACNQL